MAAQREVCIAEQRPPVGPEIRRVVGRSVVAAINQGPISRDKTVRELYGELVRKIFDAWGKQEFRRMYAKFYAEITAEQERTKTKVDWFGMLPAPRDRCATDSQLLMLAEKSGELGILVHNFIQEAANKRNGLKEVAAIVRELRFSGKPLDAKLADNIEGAVKHLDSKYSLEDFAEVS